MCRFIVCIVYIHRYTSFLTEAALTKGRINIGRICLRPDCFKAGSSRKQTIDFILTLWCRFDTFFQRYRNVLVPNCLVSCQFMVFNISDTLLVLWCLLHVYLTVPFLESLCFRLCEDPKQCSSILIWVLLGFDMLVLFIVCDCTLSSLRFILIKHNDLFALAAFCWMWVFHFQSANLATRPTPMACEIWHMRSPTGFWQFFRLWNCKMR